LHNLEFYYSLAYYNGRNTNLEEHVLLSCNALYCFGDDLSPKHILEDNSRIRMKHAFQNLIALDLKVHTLQVLEVLAETDELKLKYLGLGALTTCNVPQNPDIVAANARERTLLTKIFPKLKMLEVLKANGSRVMGNSIFQLLIQLKLKLKFAVFNDISSSLPQLNVNEAGEREDWTSEVLADFGQMLLSNDATLDLSQICLNVETRGLWHDLQELNIGFTVRHAEGYHIQSDHNINLNNELIRRYLEIDY